MSKHVFGGDWTSDKPDRGGCRHCHAEGMALRLRAMGKRRYANGFRVTLHDDQVHLPRLLRQPRLIFVNSMSDLFHEDVPEESIGRVSAWPCEVTYGGDVKQAGGRYGYHQRLQNAKDYFDQFEKGKSLIFYYSNYGNPLNLADERRYAIVGMSRIRDIAKIRFFDDCSAAVRKRYAGGFIWQCDVNSHYPGRGLRLPYHLYLDKPDILNQFAFFSENPRLFKYATREISDDDALDLVQRFLEIAGTLHQLGDRSEN
jgi:hypothetical protein